MRYITWPFVKWAGGKRRLARYLADFCPKRIERYVEPFLGSGALFMYLAQTRPDFPALLSDSNSELINTYRCVRDNTDELTELLKEHQKEYYKNPPMYYYRIRDDYLLQNNVERAARMIFLNKTCYNGLYRVNKSGKFNVPHGKYVRPAICNSQALLNASKILNRNNVSIRDADYHTTTAHCKTGDLVYFDPPYLPLTKTANFTDYTTESFGYEDHVTLANEFQRLARLGCSVMLSNSDSIKIKELYAGFAIQTIGVNRSINCNARKRSGQSEIVVSNIPLQVIRRLPPRGYRALPASVPQMS